MDFNYLRKLSETAREDELELRLEQERVARQRAEVLAQVAAAKRRRLDEGPRLVEARQASTFNVGLESRTCSTQQGSNSRPADGADSDREEMDDELGQELASHLRRSTRVRAGGGSMTQVRRALHSFLSAAVGGA